MQHSGIPSKTYQRGQAGRLVGTAAHRTFQITTFSTGLKNHVMVMDFVKSNWFPAQRSANVCVIRMCEGLKSAEQAASRYEIHSRLFSSPKDHAAWERNESLSSTGLRDNRYSTNDQIAIRNLQSDVTEKKSDFTQETLASQNTKMISSIVISQMIDETKSNENGAAALRPPTLAQPAACPVHGSLADHSRVDVKRAFALLPGRLGVQDSAEWRGPGTELLPQEEPLGGGPRKGFASITVTARRVGPPTSTLVWETVGDPLCTQCGAEDALLRDPNAAASGAQPLRHRPAFICTEFFSNGSVVRLKVPEAPARLGEGHEYWITNVEGDSEDRLPPGSSRSAKSPLVFSSCVHLQVSQQCPNARYHLDGPPPPGSPPPRRAAVSRHLDCSARGPTAGGVDGAAPAAPPRESPPPLAPRWPPGLQGAFLQPDPSLERAPLGCHARPRSGSPPPGGSESAAVGPGRVSARNGKGPLTRFHTRGQASQLCIRVPGWSYGAGGYRCCDLVVKIKECKKSEDPNTPKLKPVPPEPASSQEPEAPALPADSPEPQQAPASTLTLQEALEVHKPQFISRSQERLKKLEYMVQQRKAQRDTNLGQKQSLLPVRANKKQFTVPHPLSDNLFKPKERCISEKEMHMRSKRIYNNLPEVKKKKEEQKKRVILQSNRLRAEVFKKQLLDQLLQRNAV
ncbi:(E2-independent) E3 ubiquitin-conjugating enzyme FATS isoform X2 [Dasypus novemcinctus]|uniref:(E2-independent) E3 ubiquitin-conjugating enzyme FATS isoform X2 n=1 Tax=Dasypus novemcinctus TaxID=9361 RepID=UPI0026601615|nr:(E2-independent) E3 ubiquitin-conjugating enzyme FATS isoform X2 [Dasypus novemcinctus]